MTETFKKAKSAGRKLALLTDEKRNGILRDVADAIIAGKSYILQANVADLKKMEPSDPLYDRLMLTESRLESITAGMRNVSRRRWAAP